MIFGRIAEETIKRLLNLRQIALNFTPDLTDQQLFLSLPGHFIEQRNTGIIRRRTTGNAGIQTRYHQVDLLRKISSQPLEALLSILQEQDGRRHFHRD